MLFGKFSDINENTNVVSTYISINCGEMIESFEAIASRSDQKIMFDKATAAINLSDFGAKIDSQELL